MLQQSDENLFNALTSCSDEEKATALRKLLVVCQQRMNLAKSKQVLTVLLNGSLAHL